ncbi:MAG TPA: NADH-quinone oxidoreductase subunit J, partial [Chthonomonadaceae bacterium]|nr:NADH-quinone oxidoreductase subunit J [Chthonomonadaceae bacterium]
LMVKMPTSPARPEVYESMGTVQAIGKSLYSPDQPWLFPFEITSILLLVAVIGAIIMAKRRI